MVFLTSICLGVTGMFSVLLLREFLPFRVSVSDLELNPSAWLNQKVAVQGKLVGPIGFVAMGIPPPWNKILYDAHASLGVRGWGGTYRLENVLVIGVIRREIYEYRGREITFYYLDALEVHRLDKEA